LAADNIDVHRLPDGPVRKETMKVVHALNIRAVDGQNQIPATFPDESTSGPPELPGFNGAVYVPLIKILIISYCVRNIKDRD